MVLSVALIKTNFLVFSPRLKWAIDKTGIKRTYFQFSNENLILFNQYQSHTQIIYILKGIIINLLQVILYFILNRA